MSAAMLDKIFDTIESSNADTDAVWISALAFAGVVLRRTDQLGRERLLRGIERQLREDLAAFADIEAQKHVAS